MISRAYFRCPKVLRCTQEKDFRVWWFLDGSHASLEGLGNFLNPVWGFGWGAAVGDKTIETGISPSRMQKELCMPPRASKL